MTARAQGAVPGELLAAALAAVERQAARLAASEAERAALHAELEETNRGLLALYAELSDQKEQLERARAEAEEAGQAKAAFLATMSHELRSPLNAVIGFAALLMETDLTGEQAEYAGTVRTAAGHLLGVIDDVLDLSKIEAGSLALEEIPFDPVACVEDAVGIVAPTAEEKGLVLAALFAPGTPAAVTGDPLRLRQILVNLLANAVKFTARGEVTVEVVPEAVAGGFGRLAFHVRDTGIGIAPAALDRLLTPFTQADSATARTYGGTGLGLSICRQLAERMGGGITVESTPAAGSTFTCTVIVRLPQPAPPPDVPLAGIRVLVAHPQSLVAEAIARHLTSWGADVVTGTPDTTADLAIAGLTADPGLLAPDLLAAGRTGRRVPIVAVTPLAFRHPPTDLPADVRATITTPVRRDRLHRAVLLALGRLDEAVSPPAYAGN